MQGFYAARNTIRLPDLSGQECLQGGRAPVYRPACPEHRHLQVGGCQLGRALFSNIVALGALYQLTKVVSYEALERAVLNRVPKGTEEKNRAALAAGIAMIK